MRERLALAGRGLRLASPDLAAARTDTDGRVRHIPRRVRGGPTEGSIPADCPRKRERFWSNCANGRRGPHQRPAAIRPTR